MEDDSSSSAYVVAITRWARPFEQELVALAEPLGLTAYDLRLRVAGEPPVVLERTTDATRGRDILARVRGRGHGAVACDVATVASSESLPAVRAFELGPGALTVEHASGERVGVPYADVFALIGAMHQEVATTTTRSAQRKLSVGRAVLSGGLSFTKKVTRETRASHDDRQQVLYLFRRSGEPPVLLRERGMRYTGLGERAGPSATQNFTTLVESLRERAPDAAYDDRLVRHRRRQLDLRLSGPAGQRVTTTSNVWATDLAAHLLALAHLRGQVG